MHLRHERRHRGHRGQRPAPCDQEPLSHALDQESPHCDQLLFLFRLQLGETRAGSDDAIEGAGGVKVGDVLGLEEVEDPEYHAADLAVVAAGGGGGLKEGEWEAVPAGDDVGGGGDEDGEPVAGPEGGGGEVGDEG